MPSDEAAGSPDQRLSAVLDRIMHVWAMIKMVPEQHLSDIRVSVESELLAHGCAMESELMVIGLKYLYRVDGQRQR